MLAKLARGAVLLFFAVMIAAYAWSAAQSRAPEPQPVPTNWRMYS
jgi:hypothetical protein